MIVDVVPRLYELVGPRADIPLGRGTPLLTIPAGPSAPSIPASAKRIVDVVGAGFLLLVTSPVFLIAAIRIRLESRGRSSSVRRVSV